MSALSKIIEKFVAEAEQETLVDPEDAEERREEIRESVRDWREQFDGNRQALMLVLGALTLLKRIYGSEINLFHTYFDFGLDLLWMPEDIGMPGYLDAAAALEVRSYVGAPMTAADFTERLAVVFAMRFAQGALANAKTLRRPWPGLDLERIEGQVLVILPEVADWPLTWDVEAARQRQETKYGRKGWWRR
jgi:hypothetical protein